ncbi:TIGR02147 family protein [Bdellovibrio sp. HCB337]|uniref:TIGR02147 family protein n=1 Tax=Bdellovibrio sp. HCB337 TaxID=3394358 RepID=UPI0039A56D65
MTLPDMKAPPDVKKYLDANQYLLDFYAFRKNQSGDFTYEVWSKILGVSSRSYLRSVVAGKRSIPELLTQKLADFLELNYEDKEYFYLLVIYSQCREPEQKKLYATKLIELLKRAVDYTVVSPQENLLANPLIVIIRNILTYTDIKRDQEMLVRLTGQTKEVIAASLQVLLNAGLVEAVGDEWWATQKILKFEDQAHNQALLQYHEESLKKAIASQHRPASERNYRSITLGLNEQEYQDYLKQQGAFIQSIFSQFDNDALSDRRMYQINLNLIPWTEAPYSVKNSGDGETNSPSS